MEQPDESYGRVTDAERFRPLHAAADALLERLERLHHARRSEGPAMAPWLAERAADCDRVVCLTPQAPGAAALTVAWTNFPGLQVQFGRWHVEAFPHCGCDHCDERPDQLIDELTRKTDALVEGRFSEAFDGQGLSFAFADDPPGFTNRGWMLLPEQKRPVFGKPGQHMWAPWPKR